MTRNVRIAVTASHSIVMTNNADYRVAMGGYRALVKTGTGTTLLDAPHHFGFNTCPTRYALEPGFA